MTNNHKDKPVEIDAKQIKVDDKVAELSIQKRAESQGALMAGNFADTMWFVRQYDDALVAPWWSEQRDADLRGFVLQDGNDILQGAISSMIKKIKALPWFLEGPQRVVKRYQEPLANADFGGGWGVFLGKLLYDYLTQDKGGFTEFIGDGKPDGPITGPVLGLAHLDAGLCQLTGDPIYPVLYRNPKTGKPNKLHATRVGHIVDTPSPNETMNNVGFCSTSRTIASSRILLKLAQYKNEKLDDLPEAGLLLFNNLMPSKWEDARKNYQRERRRIGQELWSPIMTLFGIDPAQPVTAQLISFANLPENFDELTSTNIYVNIVALAFGVDVREFWPMSQGSLGTATESTVMAAKAKGKGPGDIISGVERLINWYMLPESVTFRFDVQDDDEDKLRADINKTRTDTIMSMWKPPDAGQLAAGVIAPVTPVEIRQMLADNVPYFNKDFLEVDLTDEVTVSDTDQEEADDDKAFGCMVRIDQKGNVTVPRKVKRMTEAGRVLAQAEKNFRDGKISLDDLIEFRLGTVMDNKSYPGHAGRPGQVGGSRPRGGNSGISISEIDRILPQGANEEDDADYVSGQSDKIMREFGDITDENEYLSEIPMDWATSPDYGNAIFLQKGTEQAFNLPSSEKLDSRLPNPNANFSDEQKISKIIYNNTQSYLVSRGFKPDDEITLFRGTDIDQSRGGKLTTSVLDSWTTDKQIAQFYAQRNTPSGKGKIIIAKVPIKDIFSLPQTGIGIPSAKEVVIFGSKPHLVNIENAS